MDPIIQLMEKHKKEDEARKKARNDTVKKTFNYTGKAIKYTGKAAKYIGFKGAIGGLAGLALAGPIGGLVGIVAGKNSRKVYDKSKDLVANTFDVYSKAEKYEELNPEARYTPTSYEAGARNLHKNTIIYAINKAKGIKSKLDNCREYAKLEEEAKKLSVENNVKISAKDIFKIKKKDKENKEKIGRANELRKQMNIKLATIEAEPEEIERIRRENFVNGYNALVSEYNGILRELGEEDPRHYFRRIAAYKPENPEQPEIEQPTEKRQPLVRLYDSFGNPRD